MKIRVAGFVNDSIVDGPGLRYTIFTQGCTHNCMGCHNPHTHALEAGSLVEIDEIVEKVKQNPLLDGITISGGEPFLQPEACAALASKVKELNLNVIVYTGFCYEDLVKSEKTLKLLKEADVLIDGQFILSEKSLSLMFRGSTNQRLIDVQKSLHSKDEVVLYNVNEYGELY